MNDDREGMAPAARRACAGCPWRRSNAGKRHHDGWYTQKNRRRLWAALRSGRAPAMSCHPTDPEMVGDAAELPTRECAGLLTLVQRELHALNDIGSVREYRTRRPHGLTTDGLTYWALSRNTFARTLLGGVTMTAVDLSDTDVGFEWIDERGAP